MDQRSILYSYSSFCISGNRIVNEIYYCYYVNLKYERHYVYDQNKEGIRFCNPEDLKQVDAIEILEEAIPEWQKQEHLNALQK